MFEFFCGLGGVDQVVCVMVYGIFVVGFFIDFVYGMVVVGGILGWKYEGCGIKWMFV